jgi:hypothetical protein
MLESVVIRVAAWTAWRVDRALGADKGAAEAVKERQSLLLLLETKLAETKVICLTIGQPHEQSVCRPASCGPLNANPFEQGSSAPSDRRNVTCSKWIT